MSEERYRTQSSMTFGSALSRDEYLRKIAASGQPLDIKLTNNYAFRKIFKNVTVLKGFIMPLLHLKEEEIVSIDVADPFEHGEDEKEKEGILDIKVELNHDRRINIEMQNQFQEDWAERSIFYNCRMFTEGFTHGTPYGELVPCIHVGILNFNQLSSPGFHHCIKLLEEKTCEQYSSKFLFHVIELKKTETASPPEDPQEKELFRWARLIAAKDWDAVRAEAEGNVYREEAVDEMSRINQDEMERYLYLRKEMAVRDEQSRLFYAEKRGEERGRLAGEMSRIITLVQKKYKKGKSLEETADELECEPAEIKEIYRTVQADPDIKAEEILQRLTGNDKRDENAENNSGQR